MSEATRRPTETTGPAPAAREAFAGWVEESGTEGRVFGQVLVRVYASGYLLRHAEDAGADGLEAHQEPRAARDISKTTAAGE